MSSSNLDKTKQVTELLDADVLLGRGKRAVNWEGNVRFRSLVKTFAGEYEKTTDPHIRDSIANSVMASIKETGGRFLQLHLSSNDDDQPNTWVTISETSARTKVKQALRDVTKMSRTKKKKKRPFRSEHTSGDLVTEDLEPRPIEEMVRSASTSRMVDSTTLLLQQQILRRQQSMPSTSAQQLRDQGMFQQQESHYHQQQLTAPPLEDPPEPLPFYAQSTPSSNPPPPHQDFDSILQRQQDILSRQLAKEQNARTRYNQRATLAVNRIIHHPVGFSASEPFLDTMIGRAAPSTALLCLDEAIQAQLKADQQRQKDAVQEDHEEDHSTLGSFVFDDELSDGDDRKPAARQRGQHPDDRI